MYLHAQLLVGVSPLWEVGPNLAAGQALVGVLPLPAGRVRFPDPLVSAAAGASRRVVTRGGADAPTDAVVARCQPAATAQRRRPRA